MCKTLIINNISAFTIARMNNWAFYIIENAGKTYAGVSPDPKRRLRQHNKEISGGAKYTTSHAPGWKHVCLVHGFENKIQAMQFEWAVKHVPPRNKGGLSWRMKKLLAVFNKTKWTSKSPYANSVPLSIRFELPYCIPTDWQTPVYITLDPPEICDPHEAAADHEVLACSELDHPQQTLPET